MYSRVPVRGEAQRRADEVAITRRLRALGDLQEVALQVVRERMAELHRFDISDSEYDQEHSSLQAERDRIKRAIKEGERAQLEQLASLAAVDDDEL